MRLQRERKIELGRRRRRVRFDRPLRGLKRLVLAVLDERDVRPQPVRQREAGIEPQRLLERRAGACHLALQQVEQRALRERRRQAAESARRVRERSSRSGKVAPLEAREREPEQHRRHWRRHGGESRDRLVGPALFEQHPPETGERGPVRRVRRDRSTEPCPRLVASAEIVQQLSDTGLAYGVGRRRFHLGLRRREQLLEPASVRSDERVVAKTVNARVVEAPLHGVLRADQDLLHRRFAGPRDPEFACLQHHCAERVVEIHCAFEHRQPRLPVGDDRKVELGPPDPCGDGRRLDLERARRDGGLQPQLADRHLEQGPPHPQRGRDDSDGRARLHRAEVEPGVRVQLHPRFVRKQDCGPAARTGAHQIAGEELLAGLDELNATIPLHVDLPLDDDYAGGRLLLRHDERSGQDRREHQHPRKPFSRTGSVDHVSSYPCLLAIVATPSQSAGGGVTWNARTRSTYRRLGPSFGSIASACSKCRSARAQSRAS